MNPEHEGLAKRKRFSCEDGAGGCLKGINNVREGADFIVRFEDGGLGFVL